MILKNIILRHTLLPALLLTPFTAGLMAQEPLRQEITVDHEVVPESRDIQRMNLNPTMTLPKVAEKHMTYSSRMVNIAVPGTISTLDPAAYADTIPTSPWRGYVAGGIFPLFNADLSAGYKFVDNDHTRFAGFLQYNGSVYRGKYPTDMAEKQYVRRHSATMDLSLHQAVGTKSFIDAGADFALSRYNMPAGRTLTPQIMRRIGLQATFTSSAQNISYNAGMKYSHFAFNNNIGSDMIIGREALNPVRENIFGFLGRARTSLDGRSTLGLDIDVDIVADTRRSVATFDPLIATYLFSSYGDYTHGLASVKPFYRFDYSNLRLDIGARVDISFKAGKAFHIAPDIKATWRPLKMLAIFAKAGGGEHQNTLSSLFGDTPYAATMMAYANSHIPITLDAGLTIGTWKGLYLQLAAGYARANDWLMPVTDADCMTFFKPIDLKGGHWSVRAGYTYRKLASLTLSYEGAPQGYDKGYYLWRDRAKSVAGAELKVTPIKALDVNIGYELRSGRAMIDRNPGDGLAIPPYAVSYSLGRISNLKAGACYRYTRRLSFFVEAENILCNKYRHIGLVAGQGIHGLLGASYKF